MTYTIEYRPIPEYSRYVAGSDGSIWSRAFTKSHAKRPHAILRTGADGVVWLKLSKCQRTRRPAPPLLSDSGVIHPRRWSIFVLTAFSGELPCGRVCRHLNDKPHDDRPENLAWGSRADNAHDAMRNGRLAVGVQAHSAKLNPESVREIRRLRKAGVSERRLAVQFGVCQQVVNAAVRGRTWKHVPLEGD